jgi:PKD repeat protein
MGANHEATYTDTKTPPNTWIGMPLWFLAGFVDDADQHSNNAYNEELAEAGYDIVVMGSGGFTKVFDSVPTIRSNDFIVANTKNGAHILESDATNWPLKLVGTQATGGKSVGGIHTIILNYPPMPSSITVPSPMNVGSMVTASGTFTESDMDSTHTVKWDWGDGSASDGTVDETLKSVAGSHVYTAPGTYTVKFTVTDGPGSARTSDSATITIAVVSPPVADFTASPTTGLAPLLVQFTDASTGAASLSWAFGDGATSTLQNPSHTYISPGSYKVTLTATNPDGTSSKDMQILVTMPPPVAGFSANKTSGTVPLAVAFTDASTGANSWAWNFGDGTTSTEQNPVHKFTTAGTFTVTLTVTNDGGSNSKSMTITVNPKKPVARIDQDKYTGKVPLTVKFTDKSTNNPTSYLWQFGDGSTSTEKNPTHTYTKAKVYIVRLTATNSGGSDSATSIVIALPKGWFW